LEGHALSPRITSPILQFPYLVLLVSGGHCQLLVARGVGSFRMLGSTIDDSIGEAFDKTARILKLPSGAALEKTASIGDPSVYPLPVPMKRFHDCNFSFSGLKTAVLRLVQRLSSPEGSFTKQSTVSHFQAQSDLSETQVANIAASFQVILYLSMYYINITCIASSISTCS